MNYETLKKLLKSSIYEDNSIGIETLIKLKSENLEEFFKKFEDKDQFDNDMVIAGIDLGSPEGRDMSYIRKKNHWLYIGGQNVCWETDHHHKKFTRYHNSIKINLEEDY